MQYIVAAGIVIIVLLLWIIIDYTAKKMGYKSINERERCGSCSCDNESHCNNTNSEP